MQQSDTLTTLRDGDRTFHLIGTAHISQESVEEVKRSIEAIQPDTVCIELCATRYAALTDDSRWKQLDIFKVIKQRKTLLLLANLAIGAYQRRLGQQLGAIPGAEMLAAAVAAKAIGADVGLVDRDIQVTLKRTWASLSFTRKVELIGAVAEGLISHQKIDAAQVEQLKEKAHLSAMMQELADALPGIKAPLIDERDEYMMAKIRQSAGRTIVAVVGAGHLEGIRRRFGKPVDLDALERVPPRSRWIGALKWIIPALMLGAFVWGYFNHEGHTLRQMVYAWILPNSLAAALLTALAGGKPLSVLTAFVGSPITSLNPLLGAGMVVGLVEAWLRKPTVADAERINQDLTSIRGVYRNPFTRVLLVAVLSTIGSAVGAWIGASWVLSLVAA